ncbi:hepatitis A virus cellular receptor 2-like [Phoenicopterus ruber ruber]
MSWSAGGCLLRAEPLRVHQLLPCTVAARLWSVRSPAFCQSQVALPFPVVQSSFRILSLMIRIVLVAAICSPVSSETRRAKRKHFLKEFCFQSLHTEIPLSPSFSQLFPTGPTVSGSLVKGKVGQNITVPCSYSVTSSQDITSMCWGRDSCPVSKCYRPIIWTDGRQVTEQSNSRYMLKGDLLKGDVSLTIVNAEEADSGTYCCRVEISGWFNDRTSNHKVVIEKAPGSTSESSFTITRTWPSVSALETPQMASGPCSSTSDCLDVSSNLQNASVSLPRQQHSENGLYIGIGLCAVLLAILILALFLARQYLHNTKKTGDFANFFAYWRPERAGNHSALEDEIHAEENIYIIH